jgi:hypothetical protein
MDGIALVIALIALTLSVVNFLAITSEIQDRAQNISQLYDDITKWIKDIYADMARR